MCTNKFQVQLFGADGPTNVDQYNFQAEEVWCLDKPSLMELLTFVSW